MYKTFIEPLPARRRAPTIPSRRHVRQKYKKQVRQLLTKRQEMLKDSDKHRKRSEREHHYVHQSDHHNTHQRRRYDKNEKDKSYDQHDEQDLHDEYESYDQHHERDPQNQYNQYDDYVQGKQQQKLVQKTGDRSQVKRIGENKYNTRKSKAYFQGSKKKDKPVYKAREIASNAAEMAPKSNIFETHVLLGLPTQYKEKINNKNKKRPISSFNSESDQDSERPVINKLVQKIRETSSYSDEENNLKANLYDTRHGK